MRMIIIVLDGAGVHKKSLVLCSINNANNLIKNSTPTT